MNTTVMIVATRIKAVSGSYAKPRIRLTATVTMNCPITATWGDCHFGWTRAKIAGINRIRPMAKYVRLAAFDPELALAMAELTMARKTSTQPAPQAWRARMFSPGSPLPAATRPTVLAGP